VLERTGDDEERESISRIEKYRSTLLGSEEEIAVIDYGAGDPDSNRSREEMDRGVESTALVADVCKASKPAFWAELLFRLVRELEPASCVELGTSLGISAAYQGTALRLNGKGSLITLEGSPETARIAVETFRYLDLANVSVEVGPFHQTLSGVLESAAPVDYFFNDGHHDRDAVIEYFDATKPHLSEDAVVVFDDISWSPGMRKAWTEIEDDPRVSTSFDLREIGIALIGDGTSGKEQYRIPL
jgi:predicted O-methyltransferase YrrM